MSRFTGAPESIGETVVERSERALLRQYPPRLSKGLYVGTPVNVLDVGAGHDLVTLAPVKSAPGVKR